MLAFEKKVFGQVDANIDWNKKLDEEKLLILIEQKMYEILSNICVTEKERYLRAKNIKSGGYPIDMIVISPLFSEYIFSKNIVSND